MPKNEIPFPLNEIPKRTAKDIERSLELRGFDIDKLRASFKLLSEKKKGSKYHAYLCGVEAGIYYMTSKVFEVANNQRDNY